MTLELALAVKEAIKTSGQSRDEIDFLPPDITKKVQTDRYTVSFFGKSYVIDGLGIAWEVPR